MATFAPLVRSSWEMPSATQERKDCNRNYIHHPYLGSSFLSHSPGETKNTDYMHVLIAGFTGFHRFTFYRHYSYSVGWEILGSRKYHSSYSLLSLVTYQHQETICFHLIQSPKFPVILGHPFILQHNP